MKVLIDFDKKKLKVEGDLNLAVVSDILTTIKNQNHNIIDTWTLDQTEVLEKIGKQKQEEHVESEQKEEKYAVLPNYDIGACKYELVRNDGMIIDGNMYDNYYQACLEYEKYYVLEDLSNEEADKWTIKKNNTDQPRI